MFEIGAFRFCPRPWKNAAYESGTALCFAGVGAETSIK